jgi:hypothetical protein
MKSFKDYLTESKKVYEFKVRVANDCPKDCVAKIKASLQEYHPTSCSAGKSVPIQEYRKEFPENRFVSMTVFDVATQYPVNSEQVHNSIAKCLGKSLSEVLVRNVHEELEFKINHANDERTGKALVGTFADPSNNGDVVNEKHKFDLLKELSKTKHAPTQYTGVNDQILAKSMPKKAKG